MATVGKGERRARGEGHIRKYGKYWRGHVSVDGSRKYFSGLTKQAVIDKIRVHSAESLTGVRLTRARAVTPRGTASGGVTVGAFLERWMQRHRTRIRTSTAMRYDGLIRNHLKPSIGNIPLAALRYSDVDALFSGMTQKGLCRSSVAQAKCLLRMALDAAIREELLTANVAAQVRLPRASPTTQHIFTPADVWAVLAAARQISESEYARRYIALHLGLRQTEILGLAWRDVDVLGRRLSVCASLGISRGGTVRDELKTGSGLRTLVLSDELVSVLGGVQREQEALRGLHQSRDDAPFNEHGLIFTTRTGRPVHPRQDSYSWHRTLKRAGVEPTRFHDCRHTVGTMLAASGVDIGAVSKFMGHANASFTLNTYVHRSAEDAGDVGLRMTGIYGNGPSGLEVGP